MWPKQNRSAKTSTATTTTLKQNERGKSGTLPNKLGSKLDVFYRIIECLFEFEIKAYP